MLQKEILADQELSQGRELEHDSPALTRYVGIFAALYGVLLLALSVVMETFDLDLGKGASVGVPIAAVYGTCGFFAAAHGRAPDRSERRRLTWGSLLASYAVSFAAIYIGMAIAGEDFLQLISDVNQKLTPILLGVAVIIVTLVYYVLFGLMYWMLGAAAMRAIRSGDRRASR